MTGKLCGNGRRKRREPARSSRWSGAGVKGARGGLKASSGGVTLGSVSTCHAGPDLIKGIVWESSASLTVVMSPVFWKTADLLPGLLGRSGTQQQKKSTIPTWVWLFSSRIFCRIEWFFYSGLHQWELSSFRESFQSGVMSRWCNVSARRGGKLWMLPCFWTNNRFQRSFGRGHMDHWSVQPEEIKTFRTHSKLFNLMLSCATSSVSQTEWKKNVFLHF